MDRKVLMKLLAFLVLCLIVGVSYAQQPIQKMAIEKTPIAKPQPATPEECYSFNLASTAVVNKGGNWAIVDSTRPNLTIASFPGNQKADAELTLDIIKKYRMNQVCFAKPGVAFQYELVSGQAPTGVYAREVCRNFDPGALSVSNIQGRWKIVERTNVLFDFGSNEAQARLVLNIIRKHGFTRSCFVGKPVIGFHYMAQSPGIPRKTETTKTMEEHTTPPKVVLPKPVIDQLTSPDFAIQGLKFEHQNEQNSGAYGVLKLHVVNQGANYNGDVEIQFTTRPYPSNLGSSWSVSNKVIQMPINLKRGEDKWLNLLNSFWPYSDQPLSKSLLYVECDAEVRLKSIQDFNPQNNKVSKKRVFYTEGKTVFLDTAYVTSPGGQVFELNENILNPINGRDDDPTRGIPGATRCWVYDGHMSDIGLVIIYVNYGENPSTVNCGFYQQADPTLDSASQYVLDTNNAGQYQPLKTVTVPPGASVKTNEKVKFIPFSGGWSLTYMVFNIDGRLYYFRVYFTGDCSPGAKR